MKYPPAGKRGVGLARAQDFGVGFENYKKWLEHEAVVIAQIEHQKAVENIEEILHAEGIDGIIIGPYDLSGSYGFPGEYEREEIKEAVHKVEDASKKCHKPLGFHVIQPDYRILKQKIDAGYTFLGFSLDFYFLGEKVREEMAKLTSRKESEG